MTKQNYIILAFQNTNSLGAEFIIISLEELNRRLIARKHSLVKDRKVKMVFWLMPDNQLFETTNISIEAEWFWLSKGVHGRMADGLTWDYSKYLNDWSSLKKV